MRKILLFNGVEPAQVDLIINDQFDKIGKINESKRLDSAASQQLESTIDNFAEEVSPETQTSYYVRQRPIKVNLAVMAYMWSACSFAYYMINFYMKYLPGNIFTNTFASGFSEMTADALSGLIYRRLGAKTTYSGLLALSLLGGVCILFMGESTSTVLMPIFVMLAKFGISGAFNVNYVCTVDVFPTLFMATALGFCNFFSRALTILAPEVAERPPPLPMAVFTALCAGGIVLIQFVRTLKDQEKAK